MHPSSHIRSCLCSFLTFPCINSNHPFLTNCVCSHIYCSVSLRRPVISLLSLVLCIFYPVWALSLPWAWASDSIRLEECRVILKKQAIQRESLHIFWWSCIAISGAQSVMWADGTKVLLSKFESLFVMLFWRFCIVKMNQTATNQEIKRHQWFLSTESVKVFHKLRLLPFLLLNDKRTQRNAFTKGRCGAMAGKEIFS